MASRWCASPHLPSEEEGALAPTASLGCVPVEAIVESQRARQSLREYVSYNLRHNIRYGFAPTHIRGIVLIHTSERCAVPL